jgi:hypothetical protein
MNFRNKQKQLDKLDISEENLDLIHNSLPTLSGSNLGVMGAYGYYFLKVEDAKRKFNNQIVATLGFGLALAGGFLFVGTVSFAWLEAWLLLGMIEVVLVSWMTVGHKKYIQALDPAKLKYVSRLELSTTQLKEIVVLLGGKLPAHAFSDPELALLLKEELKIEENLLSMIEALKNEFEGSVDELISVATNLSK